MKSTEIKRAKTPEAVGVSSLEVKAMIDDFMENSQQLHSLIILRHGKIACELYREPYNADSPHAMYSVSKSITSTAIGFALSEGLITLETRLIDLFPEFAPKKTDPNLEKLNIYHLLTMRSGKSVSPLANKEKDWVETYFNASWYAEPGEEFLYVNENIYMLCAVIHRVTGQSVVEYLTPRLFEPLGIKVPYWETCPRGIEAGGWGLFLRSMDLAKIMLCYQQMGMFNGKRVLPEDFVRDATMFHADSGQSQSASDSVVGYGYCFWRCAGYERAYRADGLFSQFGIVFEDLDACIICTGGDIGTQQMRDTIWRHAPACFFEGRSRVPTTELSIPAYELLPVKERSPLEKELEDKKLSFGKSLVLNAAGFPTSVIPFPAVFMEKDRAGNIDDVFFDFEENELEMTWTEGDETNTVKIGLDGGYRVTPIILGSTPYTAYAHGAWLSDTELEIRIRLIETVAERVLNFRFKGSHVTLKPSSLPTIQEISETFKSKIRDVIKQPVIQPLLTEAVPKLSSVIDVPLRGSITSPNQEDEDNEHGGPWSTIEQLLTRKGRRSNEQEQPENTEAEGKDDPKPQPQAPEDEIDRNVERAEFTGLLSRLLQYLPKKSQKAEDSGQLEPQDSELVLYIKSQLAECSEPDNDYNSGYRAALEDVLSKLFTLSDER